MTKRIEHKKETLVVGLMGCIREHLGRKLSLARHDSQCNPRSQFLLTMHVSPSYQSTQNKDQHFCFVNFLETHDSLGVFRLDRLI